MTTYKFKTRVANDGTIKLPDEMFGDEEVEVIIVAKSQTKDHLESNKAKNFIDSWAGFMKGIDTEDAKYNYLSEKYK